MNWSTISVILLLATTAYCSDLGHNASLLLDNLFRGYDHRIRPQFGGPAVEVNVTAYILAIRSISEVNMEFTMDLYFRQMWHDERLKFQPFNGINEMILDSTSKPRIWEPDTFFSSEKRAHVHDVFKLNKFISIQSNGNIMISSRLTITAACPMNLKYFPMDSQICSLEAESYGMKASDISYKWQSEVGISPEVYIPQYKLVGHRTSNKLLTLMSGSYSRLSLEFFLSRASGYYVLTTYMPAVLIVFVSWTAFYVSNLAVRVIIGVIASLAVTFLAVAVNMCLPQVSYVKAIDVYLCTCLALVLATLLVNTFIEHLTPRRHQRHKDTHVSASDVEGRSKAYSRPIRFYGLPTNMTDCICIIGLLAIFVTFNLLYSVICTNASDEAIENIIAFRP